MQRVLREMEKAGIPQMVVTNPYSIDYLTGYFELPWERLWALYLNENGEHRLIANRLFTLPQEPDVQVSWYEDGQDGTALLSSFVDHTKLLGVDETMEAGVLLRLMEFNAAARYCTASFCVDTVRAHKDEQEIARMRKASLINDAAMEQFKGLIRPGMTEKQAADHMKGIYLSLGAEDLSFAPSVGFGANAADGHHEPDDTVLREGDCVLFDVGCRYQGYCSDMTRTFFYGEVSQTGRQVYETVLAAQTAAEAVIRPGIPLKEIDKTARDVITQAGYGVYFTHRLGHFIGRQVHESGDVSPLSSGIAEPGMIFSIEPGIYLPGEVGVRIEDLVLVTKDGVEVLNSYRKDLQVIGK